MMLRIRIFVSDKESLLLNSHSCERIPDKDKQKRERFICAHGLKVGDSWQKRHGSSSS